MYENKIYTQGIESYYYTHTHTHIHTHICFTKLELRKFGRVGFDKFVYTGTFYWSIRLQNRRYRVQSDGRIKRNVFRTQYYRYNVGGVSINVFVANAKTT